MIALVSLVAQIRVQLVGELARNFCPVIINQIQRIIRPDLARIESDFQLQRETGIVVIRVIEDIGGLKDKFPGIHRLQRLAVFNGHETGAVVVFVGQ